MSALHRSDVFYAFISDGDIHPHKFTICLTGTNDPIGLLLPSVVSAIRVPMDSMDSAEREAFERDTNWER